MNENVIFCTYNELTLLYFVVQLVDCLFSPVGRTPPHREKYIIARVGRARSVLDYFITGGAQLFNYC